jgi:multiple sugar transport system permease protein
MVFVGLQNYQTVLSDDTFRVALINTVYYGLGYITTGVPLALLLALILNRMIKPIRVALQTIYFIPYVTSSVAIAIVWTWIYDPTWGLLNWLLMDVLRLHYFISTPRWLFDTSLVIPSIVGVSVWQTLGYNMVIFMAGLQMIPEVYYEAAEIDGAGRWRTFKSVTLPLLKFTTIFITIITTIGAFQVFDQVYIMTKGGPGDASMVICLLIYYLAFRLYTFGEASAMSFILLCIVIVLTIMQLRYFRQL